MSGALTADFLFGHLNTATVANDAFIANALILSAMALIVLRRTEDALAEESVALGLVGAVVDGFGLQNLAIGVGFNLYGRSQSDGDFREVRLDLSIYFESHIKYIYRGVRKNALISRG